MNAEVKHKLIRSILIGLVFSFFALTFWPFMKELLLAALFAFAFHDLSEKFLARKMRRVYASLVVTFGVLLFIASPLIYVVLKTVSAIKDYTKDGIQNVPLYQITEKLLLDLNIYIASIADRLSLDASKLPDPVEFLSRYAGAIGTYTTSLLGKIPQLTLSIFIFFLALFYFLNSSEKIRSQFLKFDLLSEIETAKITTLLKHSSYLIFAISLLIAAIQAIIVTTAAYFCGFTDFFIIYIITFTFALIPMVGSVPVTAFLVLISSIQGNNTAVIVLVVAALIAGTVDNLLKPILLSSTKEALPPILTLITTIGAIIIYGPMGIFLGPILTQLALNIASIFRPDDNSGEFIADSDL